MSKRLPYFQFEPAEWLAGDIMFCTIQAQGLFTTLKAIYWQKDCDLLLEQAIKRLKHEDLFNELISEKIIKIKAGKIKINFLDEQFEKLNEKSKVNAKNGALGGRPKKKVETETKPNAFDSVIENETESKALRREEIIIRKDKKEKIIENSKSHLSDKSATNLKNLNESLFWKSLVDQWFQFYKSKFIITPTFNAVQGKHFKSILTRFEKMAKEKDKNENIDFEWTEDRAIRTLNRFLENAWQDKWLQDHFLLKNLESNFDAIINKTKITNGNQRATRNRPTT